MNTIPHPATKGPWKFQCYTCGHKFKTQNAHLRHRWGAHADQGAQAILANLAKSKREVDPLVKSVKRMRREWRKTPSGKLQTLFDEERKWKRRATIALNKLADVRSEINQFAAEQCEPKDFNEKS